MPRAGKVCAVAQCRNSSGRNKEFMYHRFPVDKETRQLWVKKSQREDEFNPNTSRICSKHFSPEDYARDLKAELLGLPPKKLLKPGAVPSLFLKHEPRHRISKRSLRLEERKRKEEHGSHLEEAISSQGSWEIERTDNTVDSSEIAEDGQMYEPREMKRILKEAIEIMKKGKDDFDRFGEYVVMELKSLRSDYYRAQLKSAIRRAIVQYSDMDERMYWSSVPSSSISSGHS